MNTANTEGVLPMAMNLAKVVLGFLKERPDEKFTARQVAEWIFAAFSEECQAKKQSGFRLFRLLCDQTEL